MNTSEIESIVHDGVVVNTDTRQGTVTVAVSGMEECGSCPASNLCNVSGQADQTIIVKALHVSDFKKGDEVEVEGSEQLHHKAILIATIIPCIVLVAVMMGVYLLTGRQISAALAGLGSMVVFFLILYLIRNRIEREFVMTVRLKK